MHKFWKQLVEEEFASIANDLSSLTKNQRIVLQEISKYPVVTEPNATEFMQKVRLSPRSITLAIGTLEKTDHIEKIEKGFCIIDPITRSILND